MTGNVAGASQKLAGVSCVVTGAARGIGQAIAARFAREGASVACLDVSEKRLEPTVTGLLGLGLQARGYVVDVAARDSLVQALDQIASDFGQPIGVLVNNAMWTRFQPLEEVDTETLERTFGVGLHALVWGLQAVVPQMKRRGGGSVINLGSTGAKRAVGCSLVYAALKAAVVGLTRAAAVELGPHGIRVNALVPGMISTPAALANFDEPTLAERSASVPLGRFGSADEIANAALFLASGESQYVQGAELVIDGGWSIAAR